MRNWEVLDLSSKELLETCERLARWGNSDNEKCVAEKTDVSELDCNKIASGTMDTSKIHINEDILNPDNTYLECSCCGCSSNEKTVFEEVMTEVVDELEEELREIIEEASSEEELCLSCLIRFFLEKSYSLGYQEGVSYFKDRIDEANQSIRDELLTEVVESGYGD